MKNNKIIVGVDEVGRGCLAGPVISAAVILKNGIDLKNIKDSKKISFSKRLKVADYIKKILAMLLGLLLLMKYLNLTF